MLYFKASTRLTAPSTSILLFHKLIGVKFKDKTRQWNEISKKTKYNNTHASSVKVLLDFNASARLIAPSTPILLPIKLIGMKFKYKISQSNEIKLKKRNKI